MQRRIVIRVDAYTRVCLTVIAGLLALLVVGLWAEAPLPPATAEDRPKENVYVGAQRQAMIEAAEATQSHTKAMKRLVDLFESGQAKVQVVAGDGAKVVKENGAAQGEK
jgi:hypothetical protein